MRALLARKAKGTQQATPPADEPLANAAESAAPVVITPAITPTTAPTTAPAITHTPVAELQQRLTERTTKARTIEGSARSSDGATSPWLLLPPERAYRLYVPSHAAADKPLPLVVMIHGCKQSAEDFERGTRMNALADRAGFAVLYPDQATFANIQRCWNWFEPNTAAGHGECAIILEMIRAAKKQVSLDHTRIYVAGLSSGGALAGLLAFHHPDVFAAVAVHSGLPPMMPPSAAAAIAAMEKGVRVDVETLSESYWNTHELPPPPLIIVHGNEDDRVTQKNATTLMTLWEKLFSSAPLAPTLSREDREFENTDSARAYSQIDVQREARIVIRSMRVHGLAHAWSGGDAALPYNDPKGPDATAAIWKFFERQAR